MKNNFFTTRSFIYSKHFYKLYSHKYYLYFTKCNKLRGIPVGTSWLEDVETTLYRRYKH